MSSENTSKLGHSVCVCVHRITIFPAQGIIKKKWMNSKLRNKNNEKTYNN